MRHDLVGGDPRRHCHHLASPRAQLAQDVVLEAAVVDQYFFSSCIGAWLFRAGRWTEQRLLPLIGLRSGDLLDEVDAVVARQAAQAGEGLLGRLADGDHAHHDAAVAQPPRDGAGIDAADAGHPLVGEEGVERGGAQRVARCRGVLPDDEAGDLDAGRLEVTLVDAVVAD